MSLIGTLCDKPSSIESSSTFTTLNGIIYMVGGFLLIVWPAAVQTLFFDPEFAGHESALVQILGMTLASIGWLYFFGGRSGSRQFVASTVVDRIVIVPLVLLPIAWAGVFPRLFVTFAILDPVLGLVAWYLLKKEQPTDSGTTSV